MDKKKFFSSTKNRILLVVGIAVLLGALCFSAFNKPGVNTTTDSKEIDVSAKYWPVGTDYSLNLKTDASSILSDITDQSHTGMFAVVDDKVGGSYSEVYHLRNKAACGIIGGQNDNIDYEGDAGIKVATNGMKVTCRWYSHYTEKYVNGNLFIRQNSRQKPHFIGDLSDGNIITFDYQDYIKKGILQDKPGLSELVINTEGRLVLVFLFYDGKAVRTCRVFRGYGDISHNIAIWNSVVGDIDPQNCLDMWVGREDNPITYPTSGQNGSCNHVQLWRDLSHSIITEDDWSDEYKVFRLVQYLAANYAYDDYRVHTCDNVSRANMDNAWEDDNHFMYFNKVGNCWDCANALTIMCREQGIPCTSVDNDHHTANAVWLNGEWVCIDVSVLLQHHCTEKDTNPEKWIDQRDRGYAEAYGYYETDFNTHNQGLCTPITAGSRNDNPL